MKEFRVLHIAILLTVLITISSAQNNPPENSEQGGKITEVALSVEPDKVLGRIDEKIYGHFLEHIYHSVNGGLWGEMIWNRSFEELPGSNAGHWSIEDNSIMQSNIGENIRLVFGNPQWRDYEYTLEARKKQGSEGFLILFRVADAEEFYWYNLGGWGNQRHALEKGIKGRRWGAVGRGFEGKIETDRWYRIRVRCEAPGIRRPCTEISGLNLSKARLCLRDCLNRCSQQLLPSIGTLTGRVTFNWCGMSLLIAN
jgi:hypothetical protein